MVSGMVPLSDDMMLGIMDDGLFMFIDGTFLRDVVVMDSVMICVPVAISCMFLCWLLCGVPMCGDINISCTPALVSTIFRSSIKMLMFAASASFSVSHLAFVYCVGCH